MTDQFARVCVDVDLSAEPLAGVVRGASGADQPFSGWLALTRVIEETIEAARQARSEEAEQ